METDEPSGAGRGVLLALGCVMVLVGVLVAAALAVPIQPGLPEGCGACSSATGAQIVIPPGTGSSTKLNYLPAVAVVIVGHNSTVTFVNEDSVTHTVTATDKSFDSGDIKAGASWTHTFAAPGTYSYYCIYHSAWMKGTIIVSEQENETGVQVTIPAGTGSNLKQTYQPASLLVVIGVNNTVTWANKDGVPHTVTATDGSFDSGNLVAGASWSHTFTAPGTYSYYCTYHEWMKGTVVVVEKS
ncbi:MAG TPA: cupredoxin domain-containing protein [Nitrososphaerales archaeon]|nr:cupredoxin domain-containing protein [Nitrososphaerales archaeon]